MESLYVCLFSNGHIKVGRSIDPTSRIAAHAERVACMGVEMVESYVTECPDRSDVRERILIDSCAQLASERFQSEWFAGLSFREVCTLAYQVAHREDLPEQHGTSTRWTLVIAKLRDAGWTHADLARECKCGAATISRIALGQQEEPMYSVGERLLQLLDRK